MKKVNIGSSRVLVSPIGLGCMGMSEFYGPTDDKESLSTLKKAADLGVDFLDTADMYGRGENETLLGKFLKQVNRQDFSIATKFGIVRNSLSASRSIDNSPEYIRTACESSLKRLNVEAIDLYYAHRINTEQPIEETVGAMSDLVKAGKVKAIGLCEVSADMLRKAHATHPISAVQTEYSLWTRNPEQSLLPACRELGTSLVAYCPLGRGFLTGQLTSTENLCKEDFRRSVPRFSEENIGKNLLTLQSLKSLAKKYTRTPAQIALCWLLSKGDDVIVIPGTRKENHLIENFSSGNFNLTDEDIDFLNNTIAPGSVQGERYSSEGMKNIYL